MATFAIRQLSLTDVYSLAPYVAGMALVPTMACAAGKEAPPPWPQLLLSHTQLMSHFTFMRRSTAVSGGRWWTLLSSAFCHVDGAHRDRNLISLVCSGAHPMASLGPLGFAAVFFGGHAAAAMNTAAHTMQVERVLGNLTWDVAPSLTPHAARLWSSAAPASSPC
jgi:membrane associated rhomboid family serine protease